MTGRESALLGSIVVGLVVYALAANVAEFGKDDAGLAAALWAVAMYYTVRRSQGP